MSATEPRIAIGLAGLDRLAGPLLAVVGVFDGLHRGHAALIRALVAEARARDARPTVITFDHHPDEVLTGHAPPLLLDPDERLARLGWAGVEQVVVLHFDEVLRRTSHVDFVDAIRARADLAGFVMTDGSAFGHERRGTPEVLAELGRARRFEVVTVHPLRVDGRPIQSTTIRAAIAVGDLATAADLLGRAVAVTGSSVERPDDALIAFPMPVALPPPGRYRARVGRPINVSSTAGWRGGGRSVAIRPDGAVAVGKPVGGVARLRIAFDAALDDA